MKGLELKIRDKIKRQPAKWQTDEKNSEGKCRLSQFGIVDKSKSKEAVVGVAGVNMPPLPP